jgi:hypothetical protein
VQLLVLLLLMLIGPVAIFVLGKEENETKQHRISRWVISMAVGIIFLSGLWTDNPPYFDCDFTANGWECPDSR